MRFMVAPIGFILILQQALAAAHLSKQDIEDYGLSATVGQCLIVRCQVFRGFLGTGSPKSGESFEVKVQEWLYGEPVLETAWVPYEDFRGSANKDEIGGVASAWARVGFSKNAPVAVVFGLENGFGVHAGEPVLVTSNENESRIIRYVTGEALRLEHSIDLLPGAVASLSRKANPPLAAYLFTHLVFRVTATRPELAAELLGQMLGSPSVPARQSEMIARFMAMDYYRLPQAARETMVRRLTELGMEPEVDLARAAYAGLAQIASFDNTVTAFMPPGGLAGVSTTYISLVKKGSITRNRMLETGLGIKYE
jgi:hypothetical protein